jgi:hypothetical protein
MIGGQFLQNAKLCIKRNACFVVLAFAPTRVIKCQHKVTIVHQHDDKIVEKNLFLHMATTRLVWQMCKSISCDVRTASAPVCVHASGVTQQGCGLLSLLHTHTHKQTAQEHEPFSPKEYLQGREVATQGLEYNKSAVHWWRRSQSVCQLGDNSACSIVHIQLCKLELKVWLWER